MERANTAAMARAIDSAEHHTVTKLESWPRPDLSILNEGRLPAPPLPLEVFGPFWTDWIVTSASLKSAPPDYVVAPLLSVAGILVGNARWVSPWDGWIEPPVLWTQCV